MEDGSRLSVPFRNMHAIGSAQVALKASKSGQLFQTAQSHKPHSSDYSMRDTVHGSAGNRGSLCLVYPLSYLATKPRNTEKSMTEQNLPRPHCWLSRAHSEHGKASVRQPPSSRRTWIGAILITL